MTSEGTSLFSKRDRGSVRQVASPEFGKGVLSTIRVSSWHLAYCAFLAIFSVVLIFLLLLEDQTLPPEPRLVALDGLIVFLLTAEVSIVYMLLGKHFWSYPWHTFDFFIVLASIVGFVILVLEMTQTLNFLNGAVAVVFTVVRNVTQVIRVLRYVVVGHSARKAQEALEEGGAVTFPDSTNPIEFDE